MVLITSGPEEMFVSEKLNSFKLKEDFSNLLEVECSMEKEYLFCIVCMKEKTACSSHSFCQLLHDSVGGHKKTKIP